MRRVAACIAVVVCLGAAGASHHNIDLQATSEQPGNTVADDTSADLKALEEMLGNSRRPRWWVEAPALTILGSVMNYRPGNGSEYVATSERLSNTDIDEMVNDLTGALHVLSAGKYLKFASVNILSAPAGSTVNVATPDHIVVGRFKGLRQTTKAVGLGGRRTRQDRTIMTGLVILDSDYDRTSPKRHLLRTHELGHALGYNHVRSRESIMNLHLGPSPNGFDYKAARIAFGPRMPGFPRAHQ